MESVKQTFVITSAVDHTGKDGYTVKFDTTGMTICSAIADKAVGIITKGGLVNDEVCIFGKCLGLLGGTVVAGQYVTPHTDGTIVATAGSSSEFGMALESGVAGAWVQIFVFGAANLRT